MCKPLISIVDRILIGNCQKIKKCPIAIFFIYGWWQIQNKDLNYLHFMFFLFSLIINVTEIGPNFSLFRDLPREGAFGLCMPPTPSSHAKFVLIWQKYIQRCKIKSNLHGNLVCCSHFA